MYLPSPQGDSDVCLLWFLSRSPPKPHVLRGAACEVTGHGEVMLTSGQLTARLGGKA